MQLRGQRFGLQEPGPSGLGISALGFSFAQAGHPSDLGEPIKKIPYTLNVLQRFIATLLTMPTQGAWLCYPRAYMVSVYTKALKHLITYIGNSLRPK